MWLTLVQSPCVRRGTPGGTGIITTTTNLCKSRHFHRDMAFGSFPRQRRIHTCLHSVAGCVSRYRVVNRSKYVARRSAQQLQSSSRRGIGILVNDLTNRRSLVRLVLIIMLDRLKKEETQVVTYVAGLNFPFPCISVDETRSERRCHG